MKYMLVSILSKQTCYCFAY